ncbi:MAG: hypothetical protein A2020_03995 [Lentisphaerae bacterium GWF2_45_14]|nr:MAG: hypothetical protein A2020_03995 [Lentisphaerae bacterium GWF2_45_14]
MTQEQESSAAPGFERRLMIKNISTMDGLPMPSPRMMKILTLLKGELDAERLARAIERTPDLSERIIKEVNSGVYGISRYVSGMEEAINILGALNIKHILYAVTVMSFFGSAEKEEWEHSYASSILMTNMMNKFNVSSASKLQLMMLLHDMGKLVLKKLNPKKYKQAIDISAQSNIPIFKAEESVFHINHAIAGGILMKKWGMTDEVIIPIAHHHSDFVPGREFIYDTTLIQFCDWLDECARNKPSAPPSDQMLRYAGLDNLNIDFWTRYQQATIRIIESLALENMEYHDSGEWLNYSKIFIPVELPEKHQLKLQMQKKADDEKIHTSIRRPIKSISSAGNHISDTSTHKFRRPTMKSNSPVIELASNQTVSRLTSPSRKEESESTSTRVFGRPPKPSFNEFKETQTLRRPLKFIPQKKYTSND